MSSYDIGGNRSFIKTALGCSYYRFGSFLFNFPFLFRLYFELQQLLWSSFAIYSSGSYCGSSFTTFKFTMDGDDGHVPVGGAPPGPGPGPAAPLVLLPAVEPLQVFGDIEAAVNAIAVDDPASMINILEVMSARLNTLTLEQKLYKSENAMRLTVARKKKVVATLSKLTNPKSQRAVTTSSST